MGYFTETLNSIMEGKCGGGKSSGYSNPPKKEEKDSKKSEGCKKDGGCQ